MNGSNLSPSFNCAWEIGGFVCTSSSCLIGTEGQVDLISLWERTALSAARKSSAQEVIAGM